MSARRLAAAAAVLLVAAGCAGGGAQSGGTGSGPPPPSAPPFTARATGLRKPWVTTAGGRFVDQDDKPVLLRGVNMSVGQAALAPAAAGLGANLVRIHVGWSAIEPKPPVHGKYRWDTHVLDQLDQEVEAFQRLHVNVLIDYHQFHWSPYFAAGHVQVGQGRMPGQRRARVVLRRRPLPGDEERRGPGRGGLLDVGVVRSRRATTPPSPA